MKIKITVDSTADLSKELLQKNDIAVSPLYVHFDEEEKQDGITCTPEDIYEFVEKTNNLPKTSAVSQEDYEKFFEENLKDHDALIHFNLSSKMSVTNTNAVNASKKYENVFVIDSQNLSTGTGLLALYACDLRDEGKDVKTIVEMVNEKVSKVSASFVLDKLHFLHKGGRCSTISLLGANLLGIKPCIQVKDGAMGVAKKYVGKFEKVVIKYVEDQIANNPNIEPKRIFITHTKIDSEIVANVKTFLESLHYFDEILETTAGCTITTHCGSNTLGVLFINK